MIHYVQGDLYWFALRAEALSEGLERIAWPLPESFLFSSACF